MERLPPSVQQWRERGRHVDVLGMRIFVVDSGPPNSGDVALVLHGFPTSSHDWHLALPLLGARRVVLLDLPGYGLSDKPPDYSYSLFEQADVVELVLRELGVHRAHLVTHDMGTSIACELLARRERGLLTFDPRSLLLMNGSVHIELSHLTPSQRLLRSPLAPLFARVGSAHVFKLQMRRILGQPIAEEELEAMWAQLLYNDGKGRLPEIIRYIDERHRFWHRWIEPLRRLSDIPAHVLWGPEDPVAVFAIAERLGSEIPGARLQRLEGLGHYPQLEDPEATGAAIRRFLDGVEQAYPIPASASKEQDGA
jgi:pimeloyl-ACP methyl ester carboxylesterase